MIVSRYIGHMNRNTPVESSDFVIIGSGIAGLFTALKASEFGSVLVLTKKSMEDSKLSWVDENAYYHYITMLPGLPYQFQVPFMQVTHSWYQSYLPALHFLLFTPVLYRLNLFKYPHNIFPFTLPNTGVPILRPVC